MSLEKAVKYKKEKRKPYRKSKAFDWTCRCHGSCSYCRDNRLYFDKKHRMVADEKLKDFLDKRDNDD